MGKHLLHLALGFALVIPAHIATLLRESFDLRVPTQPAPVLVNGAQRLVYELHLTNFVCEPLSQGPPREAR